MVLFVIIQFTPCGSKANLSILCNIVLHASAEMARMKLFTFSPFLLIIFLTLNTKAFEIF